MNYIGIDLGTSSVKLVLMDTEGHIIANVSKSYPIDYPKAVTAFCARVASAA